jgi:hypothetical protein
VRSSFRDSAKLASVACELFHAGGYTPVAIERVRKWLRVLGLFVRRCAKECVTA